MTEDEKRERLEQVTRTAAEANRSMWTITEAAETTGILPATLRWHCRRGLMAGRAVAFGPLWLIPTDVLLDFARQYERWGKVEP